MHKFLALIVSVSLLCGLFTPVALAQDASATPATPAPAAPLDIAVELGDFFVTLSRTAVIAGQPYRFVVTNAGEATHEFVLEPGSAVDQPLESPGGASEIEDIAPGETRELIWTFEEPGTYQAACHVPAHFEAGMTAAFEVLPADTEVVKVEVGDFFLKPNNTELKAGVPYLFEVTNTGGEIHEFVLEPAGAVDEPLEVEIDGEEAESEIEDIASGQTKALLWTFDQPGAYAMACHIPAHYEAGMKADFNVVP